MTDEIFLDTLEHIKILSNEPMIQRNITIYEFLKAIDIVISDYSSAG